MKKIITLILLIITHNCFGQGNYSDHSGNADSLGHQIPRFYNDLHNSFGNITESQVTNLVSDLSTINSALLQRLLYTDTAPMLTNYIRNTANALKLNISDTAGLVANYAKTSVVNGKEPSITAGTTSQYWRGDKSWQTLSTANVTEVTNLYFTNARAQSSITLTTTGTSGTATYSSGTLNIPNYTSGGGSGTVTSVTSADANATVATTTTTPVITVVSAPKLQTARTIDGVSFDGTANISTSRYFQMNPLMCGSTPAPSSNVTYFYGTPYNSTLLNTAGGSRSYITVTGTLIYATVYVTFLGSPTSANVPFYIRYDNTTDVLIGNINFSGGSPQVLSATISMSVTQGHYIEGKVGFPVMATMPTSVVVRTYIGESY